MLYAIQHNKAGRNFNQQEINWRHLFKSSEDSLTSMVFERLFYLPHELFWSILKEACYGNELPYFSGPILNKEFWPHWDGINTSNVNMVEPDLFIQFQQFDLIIEAKRWDYNQQTKGQWNNEIKAYRNEFEESHKELYFIALGGLFEKETEMLDGVKVLKCHWNRILLKIIESQCRLSASSGIISSMNSVTNILSDLILVFQLHGYSTGEWLATLPIKNYKIGYSMHFLFNKPLKFDSRYWFTSIPSIYNINSKSIIKQWKI